MPRHLVFSNRHNARALSLGLRRLGLRLETLSDRQGWVPRADREPEPGDVLFFTDERSLQKYIGEPDSYAFLPRAFDTGLIDDKLEWARAATAAGEVSVPFWELTASGPVTPPELPVYLKGRHSYIGWEKLPRGFICRTTADVEAALQRLEADGWRRDQFFWQRLMTGPVSNGYSVCGFADAADPDRNVMIVTRRLLGDRPTFISCSAVVETVPDPEALLPRTSRLLQAFNFTGPFELEFLKDPVSGRFYVLEFNPRFWMQHGLFIEAYDNVLIRRYLNLEAPMFPGGAPFRSMVWINTVDLLYNLGGVLGGDAERRRVYLDAWRRQRAGHTRIIWSPGLIEAARGVLAERLRAVGLRLRGRSSRSPS